MTGAAMVLTGEWKKPGVFNVEEMNPDPFMDGLNKWGCRGRRIAIPFWLTDIDFGGF